MPQFLHGALALAAVCLLFAASRLWFDRRDEAETAGARAIAEVGIGTLAALAAFGWIWSLDPAFADWPRERVFALAAFAGAVTVAAAACLPSPFAGPREDRRPLRRPSARLPEPPDGPPPGAV